ncbi:uncharacterized protein SCODWIG_01349 [Saccharomycodes ludwigii]|uniref:FAS1 domain-containing protein n=1 Tax=Saccharomycodes ludwigii TaxID=36035 RepID=A0A376B4H1_9ASCO|nr:hypothetical protein SCDLUD_004670 [Saccharomycodes ludwigii]KAH3899237.1 hypothetical protein SCDLUD_004670 [Saccharomycodes ludwigii]SSD59588.1 uncharacterized protein SCODWIG_01349 [Saccharomycodes ludwigii]
MGFKSFKFFLQKFFVLQLLFLLAKCKIDNTDPQEPPEFTTVIDLLSQNVMFSRFLLQVQRHGYIDYLNGLDNFTLLAPINSAFTYSNYEDDFEFDIDEYIVYNNVIKVDENYNRNESFLIKSGVKIPFIWNHFYQQEADKLQIQLYRSSITDKIRVLDFNYIPTLQNASMHSIDKLLPLMHPPTLPQLLETYSLENHGNISFIKKFVNDSKETFSELLNDTTLLVPSDKTLNKQFKDIEVNYLLLDEKDISNPSSGLVLKADRIKLLENLNILGMHVGLCNVDEKKETTVKFLNGKSGKITFNAFQNIIINDDMFSSSGPQITFSSPEVNEITSENVVYFFDDMSDLSYNITFNTEKYLLSLNAFEFINELYIRHLECLINDQSFNRNITLFVSVPQMNKGLANDDYLINSGAKASSGGFTKHQLIYHFLEDTIWLNETFHSDNSLLMRSARLVNSMFCDNNALMGGNCQKLKLSKLSNNNNDDNNAIYRVNNKAQVINNTPLQVGSTLIYLVDNDFSLPGNIIQSVSSFFHCSKSLLFLDQLNLLDLKPNKHGYTIFLPCYDSWDDLELNLDYIKSNVTALSMVMKNYIFEGLFYSDTELKNYTFKNLLGGNVQLNVDSCNEDTVDISISSINTNGGNLTIGKNRDIIFEQGVVHPLDKLYFPLDLDITLSALIKTTGSSEYLLFFEKFPNLNVIFEHNLPNSILVPTESSLLLDGDEMSLNSSRLEDTLKMHIISTNSTASILNCGRDIMTEYGEELVCKEVSPGNYFIKLKNSVADKEVRVLKKGCSTNNNTSCIFVIDRPLSLNWLNKEKPYHLHLPYISFAMGIIIGIFGLVFIYFLIMHEVSKRSTYSSLTPILSPSSSHLNTEPSLSNVQTGNSEIDNEGENANLRTPLLQAHLARRPSSSNSNYQSMINSERNQGFENHYSQNSLSNPIEVRKKRSVIDSTGNV